MNLSPIAGTELDFLVDMIQRIAVRTVNSKAAISYL